MRRRGGRAVGREGEDEEKIVRERRRNVLNDLR